MKSTRSSCSTVADNPQPPSTESLPAARIGFPFSCRDLLQPRQRPVVVLALSTPTMRLPPRLRALPLCFALAALAQQPPQPIPEFRFSEIAPAVLAAAAKAEIPINGFDATIARTELLQGDKVVALVDHIDGKKHKQWLVQLAARDLTAEEKARPPLQSVRAYTSTGHTYEYSGRLAAIAIHCLGPYSIDVPTANAAKRAKDQWSGALVNSDYLGLGFDMSCRMNLRLREVVRSIGERENRPVTMSINLSSGPEPFPPAEPIRNQDTDVFTPTESEERAHAGGSLALMEFFNVAQRTPGLADVLASVVDIPWFSILSHGGRMPGIEIENLNPVRALESVEWWLPSGTPLYAKPFLLHLNGKPALLCQLAVIAPQPPFLASAGIVGIAAQRPDGKGPQLSIRLIAARLAPEAAVAAVRE